MDQGQPGRRRRTYSAAFKAEAVAACRRPGVSLAAMALERSINANLLRRWVLEATRASGGVARSATALAAPAATLTKESFVALPLQRRAVDELAIKIELQRGGVSVSVQWPACAGHECAAWLREVLK